MRAVTSSFTSRVMVTVPKRSRRRSKAAAVARPINGLASAATNLAIARDGGLRRRPVPALELRDDVGERELAHREQQQQVIDEIGRLGRHARLSCAAAASASSTPSSPSFCATFSMPCDASRAV